MQGMSQQVPIHTLEKESDSNFYLNIPYFNLKQVKQYKLNLEQPSSSDNETLDSVWGNLNRITA